MCKMFVHIECDYKHPGIVALTANSTEIVQFVHHYRTLITFSSFTQLLAFSLLQSCEFLHNKNMAVYVLHVWCLSHSKFKNICKSSVARHSILGQILKSFVFDNTVFVSYKVCVVIFDWFYCVLFKLIRSVRINK